MKFATGALISLAILVGPTARAQELRFEDCIPGPGEAPKASVDHAGKTYPLRSEPCRVEFLSDPERYAQLYDALRELERSGQKAPDKGAASLVPS